MSEIIPRRQTGEVAINASATAVAPSATLRPFLGLHVMRRKGDHGEMWRFIESVDRVGQTWRLDADMLRGAAENEAAIPGDADMQREINDLKAISKKWATGEQMARIVSAMCDAIPAFDPAKNGAYIDALLMVLEAEQAIKPFTPHALAGAAFKLFRSERFAPEPDKLVEALRDEQQAINNHGRMLDRTIKARSKLRELEAKAEREVA